MAGRAGRRGKDQQGDVFLLVRDLPCVSVIMNITQKTTDQVKSRFRISYAMILNIIRVQDLSLESMLSHSSWRPYVCASSTRSSTGRCLWRWRVRRRR